MEVVRCVTVFNVIILIVILSVDNVNPSGFGYSNKLASYWLPEARELKQALGFNEDTYLNFTELTTKYGYESEEHTVTTKDGYILTVFRILSKCDNTMPYPVLLMHGLIDSSHVFISGSTEIGLGYVLAKNCYDVWAANHRGNLYSRKHVSLDPDKDIEFWNYTFDDHGNFDLPALIDYILRITSKPKLFYVGHSQGTTDFLVMSSLRPEYNQKVQLSVLLAPVAFCGNMSTLIKLLASSASYIKEFLDGAGYREILGRHQINHFIVEILCQFVPDLVCGTSYKLSTGYEIGSINPNTLSVVFGHLLAGTSTKNLIHFSQLVLSKKFRRFNEGFRENMKRYHSATPPDYNVTQITSPVVIVSGKNDYLSSLKDVDILASKLPNLLENYVVPIDKWSHINHVYDKRAPEYVHPIILKYFERYSST